MGETTSADITKNSNITGGGVLKHSNQPISILNNRSTSCSLGGKVESRVGTIHQGHGQQGVHGCGVEESRDGGVGVAEKRPGRVVSMERSLGASPVKSDGGSVVGSAAAKAYGSNFASPEPLSPELLEHKMKVTTHGLDMSPESPFIGSASSLNSPLSFSKYSTVGAAAVSFTVPGNSEKISHRGSISTRPPNASQKHYVPLGVVTCGLGAGPGISALAGGGTISVNANNNSNNSEGNHPDSDSSANSSRQNSTVHMPGDFIYFDLPLNLPLTPISPPQASATSSFNKKHVTHHNSNRAIIGEDTGPQVPFTKFFQKQDDEKIHILIGATGSVATMKVPLIIDKFFKIYTPEKVSIQLILTKRAEHFLKGLKISKHVKIWRDEDEWFGFKRLGDPVLHVELRKWADIFLIAPLSANTLAKVANGICDNLLTSLLRVWNPTTPVIVAPAMNTFMYTHPVTKKHLSMLQEDAPYVQVLRPVEKVLVCGDIGMGGMREWIEIVEILVKSVAKIRGSAADDVQENEEENDEDNDDEDDVRPEDEETDETETDATDDDEEEGEDDDYGEDDGYNGVQHVDVELGSSNKGAITHNSSSSQTLRKRTQ